MKLDRYQRHTLIDWFSQDEVKKYRFGIVGCGAVGNEVAKNLALLGVGHIDLYDFDKIEIHNLTRSVLFRENDVGRNKVDVALLRLKELDPSIQVKSYHGDFWDHISLSDLGKYDCIFCCVDNFEARLKLNTICLISSVNLINTGIDSKYAVVEIFPFSRSSANACYECNLPDSAYERIQERYSCGWLKRIAFVEKKIPTTIITSSISGAFATSNALNLLRNSSMIESHRIFVDTFSGITTVSKLDRRLHCTACEIREKPSIITKVKNILNEKLLNDLQISEDLSIISSDPILVSYRCTTCEPNEKNDTIVFKKASLFDSSLATCIKCGDESVLVNISDSFSYKELINKFYGRSIPANFIRIEGKEIIIFFDLED